MEVERQFSENNYDGNSKYSFKVNESESNIMLSAPHSVNQMRSDKLKYAEVYTGTIVELLVKELELCYIVKTKNCEDDPNSDEHSEYRDKIVEVINNNGTKILIDIHGAAKSRKFDIELGTGRGLNIDYDDNIIVIFKEEAVRYGIDLLVDDFFVALGKNTVSKYVKDRTKAFTVQLEINKKYRSPETDIERFETVIKYLSSVITRLNEYIESRELDMKDERCYFCDGLSEYKEIEYDNPKWGDIEKTVKEKTHAYVCSECGEIVFDWKEAKRLQDLSMGYK